MDVNLIYKETCLTFNITPFMPISYLRTLAHKTFKIPDFALLLTHGNIRIGKSYNNILLKDYFKNSNPITIKVSELDTQINFKTLLSQTKENSKKALLKNFENFTNKEIKLSLNKFPQQLIKRRNNSPNNVIEKSNTINYFEREKCQECYSNHVDFYCRKDNLFLCDYCKDMKHRDHKVIEIEKNNIEQCFYLYQRILINKIKYQENSLYKLSLKINEEEENKNTEELIYLIQKLKDKEKTILNFYPSLPLEKFLEKDYSEMKREIYDLKNELHDKNLYSYKDKIKAFQILQSKELDIMDNENDIKALKSKIKFSTILNEIINSIKNQLNKIYEELNQILEDNKINPVGLAEDLKIFMSKKERKYKIKLNESDSENEEKKDEYSEKNKTRNRCITDRELSLNINTPRLPILKTNTNSNSSYSSSNSSSSKNIKNDLLKLDDENYNFDYDEKTNLINLKGKNNFLNHNSITLRNRKGLKSELSIDKKKKESSVNFLSFDNEKKKRSTINLDKVLLNGNYNEQKKDDEKKRSSIRLSIFLQNKNRIKTLDVMKVKKKKKKKHF